MAVPLVFYGPLINPVSLTEYEIHPRALLAADGSGNIAWIERDVDASDVQSVIDCRKHELQIPAACESPAITRLEDGEFILPGFVDTHTHAPQIPNIGRLVSSISLLFSLTNKLPKFFSGQEYELLDWLKYVTFPMESLFEDVKFAKKIYPAVVRRFIACGTTTCCYYGTLHLESTKVLADTILEQGQRALVGKCNMDQNDLDKNYCEPSVESSLESTKELITYIRSLNSDLIHPVLTPRFAMSCSSRLLRSLGDMAKSDSMLAIQTHISENNNEIAATKKAFPGYKSYADVYDRHGLLCERTILAHAVHLENHELDVIKKAGSGISHCPTSNFNLRSGMANVGAILDRGIKVGLGSDVSGGFSPSILTAVQHASMCSKMVALQSPSHSDSRFAGKQLSIATLLYLATLGGASLCCMQDKIGSFAPGKSFDALYVSVRAETGNPAIWSMPGELSVVGSKSRHYYRGGEEIKKQLDALLERFLFGGDDRNILKVFVQGRCIGGAYFDGPLKN